MQYRKKPIEVESYKTDKEIVIHTLEGDMKASIGDYIITGVNGEKYPCKPDIFEKTYEVVNNTNYDRQKTENENLKVENQSLRSAANSLKMHYEEAQAENERLKNILICRAEIKAEAYKEFAERLKTEYAKGMSWFKKKESYYVDVSDIDNLLKELMGENND